MIIIQKIIYSPGLYAQGASADLPYHHLDIRPENPQSRTYTLGHVQRSNISMKMFHSSRHELTSSVSRSFSLSHRSRKHCFNQSCCFTSWRIYRPQETKKLIQNRLIEDHIRPAQGGLWKLSKYMKMAVQLTHSGARGSEFWYSPEMSRMMLPWIVSQLQSSILYPALVPRSTTTG